MRTAVKNKLLLALTVLLCPQIINAQLSQTLQDPSYIRWNSIRAAGFTIIYPEGYDSLATDYARLFGHYGKAISGTSGFMPARIPVVLHPENAAWNFSISRFPSRIDLPVLPQGHLNFSRPVSELAVVNLSRKATHFQAARSNVFKPFTWMLGEFFPAAVLGLYPERWMLEGDAAVAASSLVPAGYGRYGEFLNYYMAAFDAGDVRGCKWDRWAIGSYRNHTPDLDAFGYMILSGIRTMYDKPDYTADYLTHISRRPYDIFYGSSLNKRITGGNLHRKTFRKIVDYHRDLYSAEQQLRAPFTVSSPVFPRKDGKYSSWSSTAVLPDGTLFSVLETMDKSACLIRISPDKDIERISSFPESCGRLVWSETAGRLYWSEIDSDWRWKQRQTNIIRYYDTASGKIRTLTSKINAFNPCVSPDGARIAAIYGPEPDKTSVIILDAWTGTGMDILPFPEDGVLFTECTWGEDGLYVSGVSDLGSSIYKAVADKDTGILSWQEILGPARCTIRNLGTRDSLIVFSSDASGVFDLYQLENKGDGYEAFRLVSEKYGARDFVFDGSGKKLYFSRLDHLGYDLRETDSSGLFHIPASFGSIRKSEVEKELVQQERLAFSEDTDIANVEISAPRRYRKGLHLLRLHSWAPLYCNMERLSEIKGEKLYDYVSIGATVLSQNVLGTAYGNAGYCWRPDPDGSGRVHGGHLSFTYAGWYPVIEGSFFINDRLSWNYTLAEDGTVTRAPHKGPSLAGKLDIYVPLSKETGGRTLNFLPQVSWEIDNSRYNGLLNHSVTTSAQFWLLRDMAKSEIFPRYGIGAETGIRMSYAAGSSRLPAIKLGGSWYFHMYGYFPGICSGQGGKIAVTTQMLLDKGIFNPAYAILPRGLEGTMVRDLYSPTFAALASFDYAIPIHLGDINITPLLYLNRMVITPHFDYGYSRYPQRHLCSAGSSVTFQFGRLVWAIPVELGVDYSYNFGTLFSMMNENGSRVIRHSIKPVIKISF